MAQTQPLTYVLKTHVAKLGKHQGKKVVQAHPTHRQTVSFERFCTLVSGHSTFNYMEVASILNLSADMARDLVANGSSVEYGRLGFLQPSMRSVQVPEGEAFDAARHIKSARVILRPKQRYFDLKGMRYERFSLQPASPSTAPKTKQPKKAEEGHGGSSEPSGPGSTGGHNSGL